MRKTCCLLLHFTKCSHSMHESVFTTIRGGRPTPFFTNNSIHNRVYYLELHHTKLLYTLGALLNTLLQGHLATHEVTSLATISGYSNSISSNCSSNNATFNIPLQSHPSWWKGRTLTHCDRPKGISNWPLCC